MTRFCRQERTPSVLESSKANISPQQGAPLPFVSTWEKQRAERPPLNCAARLDSRLQRQLEFPEHIAKTFLKPECSKRVVLLEHTVPWEDQIVEAHEQQRAKYLELVEACRASGWRPCCEPSEVGCRGASRAISAQSAKAPVALKGFAREENHRKHQRNEEKEACLGAACCLG